MIIDSQLVMCILFQEKVKKFNDLWDKLLENPTKFDFVLTCNSSRSKQFSAL